jgi:hypothetical protein
MTSVSARSCFVRMAYNGLLVCCLAFSMGPVLGQGSQPVMAADSSSSVLNGAELRMLNALIDRFKPVSAVQQIWAGAFEQAAKKSLGLKARVDSLERLEMDESDLLVQVGALQQKVKEVKQERNAFLSDFLSPVQQMSLDSILSPPAPSIQHFGFHDRMKCMVCKDPAGLAVPPGSPVPTLKQK